MVTSKSALMLCGATLLGLVITAAADATSIASTQTHHLSFSGPVSLPGMTLPGGTYTFELIPLHPDIVRVLSQDRSRLYFTGFTRRVPRSAGLNAQRPVTFSETSPGVAPRIEAWYPPDMLTGNAFVYPTAAR